MSKQVLLMTYDEREKYSCDICGAVPDEDGRMEHGKGCYTQSEDGGGVSWVELPKVDIMNEQAWLTSTDPAAMLAFLGDRLSERKRRLAIIAALREKGCWSSNIIGELETWTDWASQYPDSARPQPWTKWPPSPDALREVVGNPFRPVTLCGPIDGITRTEPVPNCEACQAILHWNNGTPLKLAEQAYQNRDWSLLPILADALEQGGCEEAAILEHLRGAEKCLACHGKGRRYNVIDMADGGRLKDWVPCVTCNGTGFRPVRHARGCHVIDLLTGRE